MGVKILLRNDLASTWTSKNPILGQGEIGIESDSRKLKIGDGVTAWKLLNYYQFGVSTGYVLSGGYIGTAQDLKDEIDGKVDKISGKSLSTNDLTDSLLTNINQAISDTHTHSNRVLLDSLVSNGNGKSFLANNGTYINLTILDGGNASTIF